AEMNHASLMLEHLVGEQQRADRFEQQRGAIEQPRIAGLYLNRQHWALCLACELQKTRTPVAVTYTRGRSTRDFTSREDDHRMFLFQFADDMTEAAQRAAAGHVVDRDQ